MLKVFIGPNGYGKSFSIDEEIKELKSKEKELDKWKYDDIIHNGNWICPYQERQRDRPCEAQQPVFYKVLNPRCLPKDEVFDLLLSGAGFLFVIIIIYVCKV